MNRFAYALFATTAAVPSAGMATPQDSALKARAILIAQADTAMTDGEVRKIDKDARKITIKHGEIKNLGMPPMTMVFQVKDPAMLDKVKQGDKVRFHVEQESGAMVVTSIEATK